MCARALLAGCAGLLGDRERDDEDQDCVITNAAVHDEPIWVRRRRAVAPSHKAGKRMPALARPPASCLPAHRCHECCQAMDQARGRPGWGPRADPRVLRHGRRCRSGAAGGTVDSLARPAPAMAAGVGRRQAIASPPNMLHPHTLRAGQRRRQQQQQEHPQAGAPTGPARCVWAGGRRLQAV